MRCKTCPNDIPESERGWNRAGICPDCRARKLADHALKQPEPDED